MDIWLYEMNEQQPFTQVLAYIMPSHYKFMFTDYMSKIELFVGDDTFAILAQGLYSIITHEERQRTEMDEPEPFTEHLYFLMPYCRVEFTYSRTVLITAMSFYADKLRSMFQMKEARAIQIVSRTPLKSRRQLIQLTGGTP